MGAEVPSDGHGLERGFTRTVDNRDGHAIGSEQERAYRQVKRGAGVLQRQMYLCIGAGQQRAVAVVDIDFHVQRAADRIDRAGTARDFRGEAPAGILLHTQINLGARRDVGRIVLRHIDEHPQRVRLLHMKEFTRHGGQTR